MKKLDTDWLSLKDFIDALPFYVMIIDETHHILMGNAAVRKDLGLDPEEIVGKFCPEVVHGLNSPYPGCPLEEAVQTGDSVEKELFLKESQKWFKSIAYITNKHTTKGKRVFIHMIQDISQRKEADEKLLEKIEELEKWQKHTVGREVKMVKLKEEIKELKERLSAYESR